MTNNSIIMISLLAIVLCIITLFIIIFTQNYIHKEGQKAGLSKKEIEKWQFKAALFGSLFGFSRFKKELNKKNRQK